MGLFSSSKADDYDVVYNAQELDKHYQSREDLGWRERLDLMWRTDDFGNWSPEIRVSEAPHFPRNLSFLGKICMTIPFFDLNPSGPWLVSLESISKYNL